MRITPEEDHFKTDDEAIRIWMGQGSSIHIKASTTSDDPVELSEFEALEIAEVLKNFTARI